MFQGPRRLLLEQLAGKQNGWSFGTMDSYVLICTTSSHSSILVNNSMKALPNLGSMHNNSLAHPICISKTVFSVKPHFMAFDHF